MHTCPINFSMSIQLNLPSLCLSIASWRTSSTIFPGTEVRPRGWQPPGASFLPFLTLGTLFLFFQSPGTSPGCHEFPNIPQSGISFDSIESQLWQVSVVSLLAYAGAGSRALQLFGMTSMECSEFIMYARA